MNIRIKSILKDSSVIGPVAFLIAILVGGLICYFAGFALRGRISVPSSRVQAAEKPPTWPGVEVLPGVYDDSAGNTYINTYIARRMIGTSSEINRDLMLTKTTWQKKFPQRRIVAMTYFAPGDALLIHYEEAPTAK